MKRFALPLAFLFSLALVSGCHFHVGDSVTGSGVRKSEKRELPPFTAVNATGSFSVEAVSQKPASFEIEADDNILPLIKVEVRDGVLYLKTEKSYNSKEGVVVRLNLPELSKVEATGASKFRIQGLKNDRFEVRTTGASNITASGTAKEVEIHTTGAGLVDTHSLHADKATVHSTGAAKVEVYADVELDANVSGVAQVIYSGNPKNVNQHASGAASISKKDDGGGN